MRYESEVLETETIQSQMDNRANAGWRLVTVFVHPLMADAREPVYMSFWEQA